MSARKALGDAMGSFTPRVSIVIPTFNEPLHTLKESFESVSSQTFDDFECIVVDESTDRASADNCRDLCAVDRRFRYIHPQNRIGLAESLNLGISTATAELIARFDADDICVANRLELQVRFMDETPRVGVLGGGLEIIGGRGQLLGRRSYPIEHSSIARAFQWTTPVAHPTVMFRRSMIDRYGGYDPTFHFAEDLELWLRLLGQDVRFANLSEPLVKYRQLRAFRDSAHWSANLRARVRNFQSRYLFQRVCGIVAIAAWSTIPPRFQERIFRRLMIKEL
jgi:glycosyltransferase involved in cell wall biosynthesis